MADWSQLISVGAIGAVFVGFLRWLGVIVKTLIDHKLDKRKKRSEEEYAIRAEQREEARKQAEQKQIESEAFKKANPTLPY